MASPKRGRTGKAELLLQAYLGCGIGSGFNTYAVRREGIHILPVERKNTDYSRILLSSWKGTNLVLLGDGGNNHNIIPPHLPAHKKLRAER